MRRASLQHTGRPAFKWLPRWVADECQVGESRTGRVDPAGCMDRIGDPVLDGDGQTLISRPVCASLLNGQLHFFSMAIRSGAYCSRSARSAP